MEKVCRTCKYYWSGVCLHPDMMSRDVSIYDEYIEYHFDMGNVTEAVMEQHEELGEDVIVGIIETISDYFQQNLPRGPMHFTPKDEREFFCKFYE